VKKLPIPALSLVVLVGPSGSGKSTFARAHFKSTEVLSSDAFRAMVRDDELRLDATQDAFEVLHLVARRRLAAGLLTVVDATNVHAEDRKQLVELARSMHVLPVAIVLDVDVDLCIARNDTRPDRPNSAHWVRRQHSALRRSIGRGSRTLEAEGFRYVHRLFGPDEIAAAQFERQRLWSDRRDERGPFDCIGDVHGCFDELCALLDRLGYEHVDGTRRHPAGRRALFLGDIVDRGPASLACLDLVRGMVAAGSAFCVPGNHDVKLVRALLGKKVRVGHGLEQTLAEFEALAEDERRVARAQAIEFIDGLVSHLVLDGGRLVAAHAGMPKDMQGRASGPVREFALYGQTNGEIDEYGLPVRHDWAAEYRGEATVVYGHTPVVEAEWINRTICLDTGCVFGGKLTALRYPEMELVDVPAAREYYAPIRPPAPPRASGRGAQAELDDVLDLGDITGKRIVATRLMPAVAIRGEEAAAALEVMSRYAADPRWVIHLPPTMSPSETSAQEGFLEHPREALEYFAKRGVASVVCEEKHMGSRAIVVVARDAETARRRFGVTDGSDGAVLTRTGRRFFDDGELQRALLERIRGAASRAGFWERFPGDWLCLDGELMPWSAKAQELLRRQYAAVGRAASDSLADALAAAQAAQARGIDAAALVERLGTRRAAASDMVAAYRRYCWDVASIDDYRFAPFHLLAAEGTLFTDRDHAWHMATLAELAAADGRVVMATNWRRVELADPAQVDAAIAWWCELTERGGEGMVVKPLDFVTRDAHSLVQPAVKCRGREYLRIIYGPEYTLPEHLERLRKRGLNAKRSLALREFALGLEALERFVRREPLRRVHECVFGVLALESDPIDPRL
jgi:polynucleotide kinase-phosphatase